MWSFPSVRALEMFSGAYAVPTIILMKICLLIPTTLFKHVYSIGVAVTTVLCMINLQLGYNQPANHYIFDLRPEYGDDIVEIARIIFQSFTDQLPYLTKTKRHLRRGKIRQFIKKRGWRPQMVRQRRKAFQRSIRRPADTPVVTNSSSTIKSQDLPPVSVQESTTDATSTVPHGMFDLRGPVQDLDTMVDYEPREFLGQSSCILESPSGTLLPEALC